MCIRDSFVTVVSLALLTSAWWQRDLSSLDDRGSPRLLPLAVVTTAAIFVQLILGAGFRHGAFGILPHLIGFVVVTFLIVWTCRAVRKRFGQVRDPVSYTHLDVYKRQDQQRAAMADAFKDERGKIGHLVYQYEIVPDSDKSAKAGALKDLNEGRSSTWKVDWPTASGQIEKNKVFTADQLNDTFTSIMAQRAALVAVSYTHLWA